MPTSTTQLKLLFAVSLIITLGLTTPAPLTQLLGDGFNLLQQHIRAKTLIHYSAR